MQCSNCKHTGCIQQRNTFYPKTLLVFEVDNAIDETGLTKTRKIQFPNTIEITQFGIQYQLIGINKHVHGTHWSGNMYVPWKDQCYEFDSIGAKMKEIQSGSENIAGCYENTNIAFYLKVSQN